MSFRRPSRTNTDPQVAEYLPKCRATLLPPSAPMHPMTRTRLVGLLALVALVVFTAAAFSPGLSGRFLFDDYPNIVTNERIHAESLDLASLKNAAGAYEGGWWGRPLATMSFAADHVVGGRNPFYFKLTGLGVHLLNTLLVFLLVHRLLKTPGVAPIWGFRAALVVTFAWAVHPLQVSSVLYVVQRMETLSLSFVLLAMLAYHSGRTRQIDGNPGWLPVIASIPLAALGLLSKETAILFPFYTLALELTVLGFRASNGSTSVILKRAYALGLAVGALAFVVLLPRFASQAAYEVRDFSVWERVLTQMRVLPMYLGQILLPVPSNMTFYYDALPVSQSLLSPPTTLFGALLISGMAALSWRLRKSQPVASLGLMWFLAAHLLTSNVINLELAFEHRNYFALLGVLLVALAAVGAVSCRVRPAALGVSTGAALALLVFLCVIRSATWGNPFHLAMEHVANNPESARASSDLAEQYMLMSDRNPNSPFYSMAVGEFERGASLPSASPIPEQGLILMAAVSGQQAKPEWWDSLVQKIRTRPIGPQETMTVVGLMDQHDKGVDIDANRLADAYEALLERKPMPAHMHARLGNFALAHLGDDALADRMFVEAVRRSAATNPGYATRLLESLVAGGHLRQADAVIRTANDLDLPIGRANGASPP